MAERGRGSEREREREREKGGSSNHTQAGSGREPIPAEQDGFHGDDAGMMLLY